MIIEEGKEGIDIRSSLRLRDTSFDALDLSRTKASDGSLVLGARETRTDGSKIVQRGAHRRLPLTNGACGTLGGIGSHDWRGGTEGGSEAVEKRIGIGAGGGENSGVRGNGGASVGERRGKSE